jgi:parallel beta-helix repeat protein
MSNLGQLIVANSTRVALSDCLLSNGRNGMYLHEVDNSTINNNLLFNNTALSVSSGISIGKGCEDNVLSANTLTNNFYGLYVGQGVRGNRLWGNTISKAAAQTGVFLTTDGTSYDNEFPTNNTVEGTPLRYYYGEAGLSLADIAIATSNMMNVGQMAIIASEDTSLSRISLSGGSTGLYLLHANGTRASNLSLSGNANNLACQRSDDARLADSWLANGTTNINLGNVTGFVAENSTLFGGLTSIRAAFSQASLRNSTLANSTYLSVSLLFFSLLDLVNTTHHNSSVVENSTLDVLWHFDISAFCNGQPVENATVSLANASGAAALSGATGADGTLPRSLVREYTKTANGTLHHSPHSLTVSKPTLGNYTVMLDFNRSHSVAAVLGDLTSPALTDGPAVSPASIGTSIDIAWLNATISDQGIYPGAIAAAEWYPSQSRPAILNGTGFPMLPSDGALDSRTESLHAELDLTSYSKGGRTFWAHGRDSAGHWCEWQPVSVTIVDDQGPAVTGQATLMPVTVTTRDSLIWIRLTLDDSGLGDSKITGATFEAFTPGHGTAMLTVAQLTAQDGIINGMNETLTAEVDISGLEKGSHILNITGTDEFGNLGAARGLTLTISDGEAPGQPQGLNATYTGEGAAELTWTANTEDDLAGYRIYRSMHSGSNYQLIGTAGPDSASWNDTGLQEGSTYYYVISAFDDASAPNVSPYSTEVKLLAQEQSMLERAPVPFLAIIAAATLLAVLFGGAYIMTKRKPKKPSDAEGPTDSSI